LQLIKTSVLIIHTRDVDYHDFSISFIALFLLV